MGRNNKDFHQDRAPSINVNEAVNKQKALEKGHEEVPEDKFNKTYDAWKKAGDPFRKKEKNKDD